MARATSVMGKNRLLAALPASDFAQFFSELEPVDLTLIERSEASIGR
jgi:hypothetical protein